jgi:hypothetical protein
MAIADIIFGFIIGICIILFSNTLAGFFVEAWMTTWPDQISRDGRTPAR